MERPLCDELMLLDGSGEVGSIVLACPHGHCRIETTVKLKQWGGCIGESDFRLNLSLNYFLNVYHRRTKNKNDRIKRANRRHYEHEQAHPRR